MSEMIQFELVNENHFPELLLMMQDFYAIDAYAFNKELASSNLQIFTASENIGRIWMIKNADQIAGYVILTFYFSFEFGGKTAFVDELFLKPAYRGKGIGSMVLDFISQKAKEFSLKALHLEVERHNEGGNRLYAKKGFKEHKRALLTKIMM